MSEETKTDKEPETKAFSAAAGYVIIGYPYIVSEENPAACVKVDYPEFQRLFPDADPEMTNRRKAIYPGWLTQEMFDVIFDDILEALEIDPGERVKLTINVERAL